MENWIKVAETNKLSPGQGVVIKVKGTEIALFNVEGRFYAIDNACTHSGGPLGKGRLFGTVVTCPWHGSQFNVTNGACQAAPATAKIATYPVQAENGTIFIQVA
jgi:NAD(P)H-dependent nitrite reductase small subunit